MAISNFIPTVWSESLIRALDKKYVAVANCNREFEGDIREMGNRVKICGLEGVTVGNYTKNENMLAPEILSDTYKELVINQAKYFNFQIDDIDRAQSTPRLMELALKNAANALSDAAEQYVYSLNTNAEFIVENFDPTVDNVINTLIDARTMLLKQSAVDPSDIVMEVSPEIAGLILKAKVALSTDNTDALEHGCIGNIGGCKIFVSANIPVLDEGSGIMHHCIARTRRAVAFAEQLSEIEAYRPELRFADGMKGLHLYGAKVVYPKEMVLMSFAPPTQM